MALYRSAITGRSIVRLVRCLNPHLTKAYNSTKPPDAPHGAQHFKQQSSPGAKESHTERHGHHRTHTVHHRTHDKHHHGTHEQHRHGTYEQHHHGTHDKHHETHDRHHESHDKHHETHDKHRNGTHEQHHPDAEFHSDNFHHYTVLGIKPTASMEQIKSAYYRMSKIYHPDVNQTEEAAAKFKEVTDAYEVLSNPAHRRQYDRSIGYEFNRKPRSTSEIDMEQYFVNTYVTKHRPQRGKIEYYRYMAENDERKEAARYREQQIKVVQRDQELFYRDQRKSKAEGTFVTGAQVINTMSASVFLLIAICCVCLIVSRIYDDVQWKAERKMIKRIQENIRSENTE